MLEKVFESSEYMDLKGYLHAIENVTSDMFLFILVFIYEQRPFSKKSLQTHEKSKSPLLVSNSIKLSKSPLLPANKLIASPNLKSKFSPSLTLSKSPTIIKKTLDIPNTANSGREDILRKLAGKPSVQVGIRDSKNVLLKYAHGGKPNPEELDEDVVVKGIPVNRKNRNNLSNIESIDSNKYNSNGVDKNKYSDLPITPAVKYKTEGVSKISSEDVAKLNKE